MNVRVWRIDRDAILAKLTRWAGGLAQDENVLAVILFGSLARGEQTAASDADVLIILKRSSQRFDERILRFAPSGAGIGVGVDVFPYTLAEVRKALAEGWGVARVALEEGLPLFVRGSVLEELRALARREGKGEMR